VFEIMNTSILIISFNRKTLLNRVLEALLPQMLGDDQLVVVDDGSTDGTEAMVRNLLPDVTYLKIPTHEGYKLSTRINQGLELAKHDMIWRLDSDCVPVKDCLKMLKEIFTENRIIAGGILPQDERAQVQNADHPHRLEFMQELSEWVPEAFSHWQETGEVFHPVVCFGGNLNFSK
jgi:glycosyltransferase involved in cell wall biosynthesis